MVAHPPSEIIVEVYRLVFPEWDDIEQITGGWPTSGYKLTCYITGKLIEWQHKYKGDWGAGIWMNKGFSVDRSLGDWEVQRDNITVVLKNRGFEKEGGSRNDAAAGG